MWQQSSGGWGAGWAGGRARGGQLQAELWHCVATSGACQRTWRCGRSTLMQCRTAAVTTRWRGAMPLPTGSSHPAPCPHPCTHVQGRRGGPGIPGGPGGGVLGAAPAGRLLRAAGGGGRGVHLGAAWPGEAWAGSNGGALANNEEGDACLLDAFPALSFPCSEHLSAPPYTATSCAGRPAAQASAAGTAGVFRCAAGRREQQRVRPGQPSAGGRGLGGDGVGAPGRSDR